MTSSVGQVLSINSARQSQAQTGSNSGNRTGINKVGVDGPVQFEGVGVVGDNVVDRVNHGGFNKAVYAYAREDALWWEERIGREIASGQFGENLTTLGLDLSGAVIGESWRIGDLVLEVSEPRIPCKIFAGFWDRPTLIKEFTEANRSGAYLRIIEGGAIERGMSIEVEHRPNHGITIGDVFAARSGARDKIHEIAALTDLSAEYQDWAKRVSASVH